MTLTSISEFLTFFCTSYPLPLALLLLIIGLFIFWYFKERPKQKKELEEREDMRMAEEVKRTELYTAALTRSEENSRTLTNLYDTALANSTRAIENNTAVINVLSQKLSNLEDNQNMELKTLQDVQTEDRKLVEEAIELKTLIKTKLSTK